MIALYGGAFDPPHLGHEALARAAVEQFAPERLVVLVSERPGHREVVLPADERVALARLAFPEHEEQLDPHARTVETLRAGPWTDPLVLVGADELAAFLDWREPQAVLERARLGVATRPGYARDRLQPVLERLGRPERVLFFEIEPLPISSTEIRARLARGEPISGLVSADVEREIAANGLYRG